MYERREFRFMLGNEVVIFCVCFGFFRMGEMGWCYEMLVINLQVTMKFEFLIVLIRTCWGLLFDRVQVRRRSSLSILQPPQLAHERRLQ